LVAALRSEAGRNPYDRALTELVGELSTRSEPFRKWWAAHNVRYHQTGSKRLHHPTIGELQLDYEVMEISADTGLLLAVFSAEPRSRSAEALDLLASWTATSEQPRPRARPAAHSKVEPRLPRSNPYRRSPRARPRLLLRPSAAVLPVPRSGSASGGTQHGLQQPKAALRDVAS
jgi:hypothetical protein